MADTSQLEAALINADKAGDTAAARALAAEITRVRGQAAKPAFDPSEGRLPFSPFGIDTGMTMPQGVSRFIAGAGKAFMDTGRGVGQLARDAIETVAPPQKRLSDLISGGQGKSFADTLGLPNAADADAVLAQDAPLMNTGTGIAGNIFGNVLATAPTMLLPGAGTIGGAAAIGALSGAAQPVGTKDSRAQNAGVGAIAGAALPAALRAAKVLKAGMVDPFTEAGRTRIVGGAINRAAANPAEAAANMQMAGGATPGFLPTAGQAADDAGVASLERAARAIDPAGFGDIDKTQRGALVNALRGIAKTPEERAAAVTSRNDTAKGFYDVAKQRSIASDSELEALMKRPSMQAAAQDADALARERGSTFMTGGQAPGGLVDASGVPFNQGTGATYSGASMHDLKMGLDSAIKDPARGFMGAKRDAALETKQEFIDWLEKKAPEYGEGRKAYSAMSDPINRMDIGQELYNRFVPALADSSSVPFTARAGAYAQALRNGDALAQNVTGMKGAKLDKIMGETNMDTLRGVVSDSQMKAAAETAGRGVGSDTVQKMSMSNLIDQAGLPSWVSALGPLRSVGGMAKTVGDIVFTKNDETMRHLLADVLKDPARAAEAMNKAGIKPSKYAEFLKRAGEAAAIGTADTLQNN